jgi:hypothetical protein
MAKTRETQSPEGISKKRVVCVSLAPLGRQDEMRAGGARRPNFPLRREEKGERERESLIELIESPIRRGFFIFFGNKWRHRSLFWGLHLYATNRKGSLRHAPLILINAIKG